MSSKKKREGERKMWLLSKYACDEEKHEKMIELIEELRGEVEGEGIEVSGGWSLGKYAGKVKGKGKDREKLMKSLIGKMMGKGGWIRVPLEGKEIYVKKEGELVYILGEKQLRIVDEGGKEEEVVIKKEVMRPLYEEVAGGFKVVPQEKRDRLEELLDRVGEAPSTIGEEEGIGEIEEVEEVGGIMSIKELLGEEETGVDTSGFEDTEGMWDEWEGFGKVEELPEEGKEGK